MNRMLKILSLLLIVLLLMPAFSLAQEASGDTAVQPAAEENTSEEAATPVADDDADVSTGEASSVPTGDDSSDESSADSSPSEDTDIDESTSADESDSITSDDELTGESEGNTSPEDADDTENGQEESEEKEVVDTESGNTDDSEADEKEDKEDSKDTSSSKKSSGVSYAKVRTSAIYEGAKVSVEELGTIHTQIKLSSGELCDVLTAELTFPDLEEQPLKLAYLVAPKTGRASLRDQPAKGETIIRYGNAGDLAIVLEEGEDYTYILYRGTKCYALSTTLQPIEIPEEDGEFAELSYEERTDGGTSINVRNQPDRNSCKIAEWRTGTEVTVWSYTDGWYEIEANGMRGFVMEQFISIAPGV